jgi:hypothetical protein
MAEGQTTSTNHNFRRSCSLLFLMYEYVCIYVCMCVYVRMYVCMYIYISNAARKPQEELFKNFYASHMNLVITKYD